MGGCQSATRSRRRSSASRPGLNLRRGNWISESPPMRPLWFSSAVRIATVQHLRGEGPDPHHCVASARHFAQTPDHNNLF